MNEGNLESDYQELLNKNKNGKNKFATNGNINRLDLKERIF